MSRSRVLHFSILAEIVSSPEGSLLSCDATGIVKNVSQSFKILSNAPLGTRNKKGYLTHFLQVILKDFDVSIIEIDGLTHIYSIAGEVVVTPLLRKDNPYVADVSTFEKYIADLLKVIENVGIQLKPYTSLTNTKIYSNVALHRSNVVPIIKKEIK